MPDRKIMYHHTIAYGDSLWIYKNGSMFEIINVDRTWDAVEWAERHGMVFRETVTADNNESFNIYEKRGQLIMAVPC